MALEQDQRISEVVQREQSRLRNFIRRRVPDPLDAEDILQDVFYKLVEANRLLMPIEHVTGWLFRVARNRITAFDEPSVAKATQSSDVVRFSLLLLLLLLLRPKSLFLGRNCSAQDHSWG